jgi:4-alpha-glucanotransferase
MKLDGFRWWLERMRTQFSLFDVLRVDHFRGFQAYWEIAAEEETAINGRWVEAPGKQLLATINEHFHQLPLVAEDLGVITDEVTELRISFDLPGMKILQFAFDGDPKNSYLPHNHEFNSTVYTGTHDNDTTVSWYQNLSEEERNRVCDYLGIERGTPMPWPLIRCALASTSCLAVVPLQDILVLGEGHRMNTPGTTEGNWQWRFEWQQLPDVLAHRLAEMCRLYDR